MYNALVMYLPFGYELNTTLDSRWVDGRPRVTDLDRVRYESVALDQTNCPTLPGLDKTTGRLPFPDIDDPNFDIAVADFVVARGSWLLPWIAADGVGGFGEVKVIHWPLMYKIDAGHVFTAVGPVPMTADRRERVFRTVIDRFRADGMTEQALREVGESLHKHWLVYDRWYYSTGRIGFTLTPFPGAETEADIEARDE